jgi:phage-related protein
LRGREIPERLFVRLGQSWVSNLQLLQWGELPSSYRPMQSIGAGVFELRQQDERSWYRVLYLSRIDNVIHVLHCFEKDSNKTPERDKEIAKSRLSMVKQRLQKKKKQEKKKGGRDGKKK